MKSVEFCYWLQGLFEVAEPTALNEKQTDLIKRHLNLVFVHEIDPSYPAEQQDKLNDVHSGEKLKLGGKTPDGRIMRC
jgi:hypothetical protein